MAGSDIALAAAISADGNVPAGLFDAFIENAIDNARAKAEREPGIALRMRFEFSGERVDLSVCDTGSAVPESVAGHLFREPLERASGLGIGLFHVARMATQAGYRLGLRANRDGEVCFALEADGSAPGKG